ncbi:MAG: efflux RND transporter permease subunit [Phycisphaerales bacterium]|nr:efflux RND transporter permease subunit [Phycisphaerae bacterium]NNF43386.1 efflux RND transporter permease subunit [Phycisphaerales bacterium]NNM26477.1 efflux RND transporter permease subunit [Phycisphaerales bacterium]
MLKQLIRFSLDNATLVLVLAAVLLAFAVFQLPRTPVDVFPELNAPTVVVMTEAAGLAADEVEQYVTFPVETSVNGIPGVRRVRSSSAIGLSIAYIEFDWGTDIYRARQLVSERLDTVREDLPPDAHAEMTPITSITGEIMLLAVSSPNGLVPPLELRAYAEFDLRNKLVAIPGVAQVAVIGGELPEYQVLVEQEKLRLFDLTVQDIVAAAGEAHSTVSAGYLPDVGGLELPIRQSGRVRSAADIAGTVIKYHDGAPVTIGQVAEVGRGPAPKRGTGADGGHPAVVMTVQKAPGTNTLAITEQIDAMLDTLEPTLPAGIAINRHIFRQSDFIRLSVDNVVHALRDAAIIVSVILLLFLLNLRTTLITLTALPLSLASGLLVLHAIGETINVMTLGGLAIAVGSLVDDAIIDVENVFRRLKQNAARPDGERRSKREIVFEASNEIRPAMVFATIIIALVFLPLMFLEGIEGRFFRPLGIAFVVSLLASLTVALTVTPALCALVLHARPSAREARDGFLVRGLKRLYEPTVRLSIRLRGLVLAAATVATVLALWLASSFGTSFLPEFNEGTFTIGLFAPPGTSLTASDRMASSVERQLLEVEGVRSVTRRTGRAERDEHAEPVSNSEIEVTVAPGYEKNDVRDRMTRILESIPGITTNVGQPIEHRLSHILSGTPAAIAISVYGDNLHTLRTIAKEVETALASLPGTRDVAANREVMIQSLPVEYQPQTLAAYGLTPAAAAAQVRNAIYGVEVAEVNEGVRRYGLVVRLADAERNSVEDLRRLVLRGRGGALVRLEEVAVIGPEMASNLIARENAQRKAVVSLNVAQGYNLGHLVSEVQERVDPIVEKHGYVVKYGGQFEAQQSASRTIAIFSGIVVLVMLALLHLAIGSIRVALLVLVNLPLALIGGILAIFVMESPNPVRNFAGLITGGHYTAPVISIASLVGFITLFGIAVRNGILLVNHYRHLQEVEGVPIGEAIVQGSLERLVPILMTALTAALALIPIILKGDRPGNEILAPLSAVILGGLLTSTFLNLVVVPAGYATIHRVRDAVRRNTT